MVVYWWRQLRRLSAAWRLDRGDGEAFNGDGCEGRKKLRG